MDEWPPDPYEDNEERPAPDDNPTPWERSRFSEAVGDAWESGHQRDPYGEETL